MFLGFLLFLRSGGLKVTLHDWMSLIEGLHQGLHGQSFHGFYILCRTLLVKTESDLDKFDEMFHRYFKTVDPVKISQEIRELAAQPDVAAKVFAGYFQKNDMLLGEAMLQIEERLAEARELLSAPVAVNAAALLGTNLNDEKVETIISGKFKAVLLALDNDALSTAVGHVLKYRSILPIRLVRLERDIKDMSREQADMLFSGEEYD